MTYQFITQDMLLIITQKEMLGRACGSLRKKDPLARKSPRMISGAVVTTSFQTRRSLETSSKWSSAPYFQNKGQ